MIEIMRSSLRCLRSIISLVIIGVISGTPAYAQDKACALVLMHGKWGAPQNLGPFARRLDPPCKVRLLEMPWAKRRSYDQPYPVAIQEIQAEVKAFRDQGYSKILVGGQSFGANAALAYMATVGDVDGVIVLAAGHTPRLMYQQGIGKDAVEKARELVASGKGGERLTMVDLNQGIRANISMSAEILLLSSQKFRLQKRPHPNPSPAGEGLINPRPAGEGGAKRRAALQNTEMSPLFLTAV